MKLFELADKDVLILGYGQEGRATEEFLKKHIPSARISIADQDNGPDYLAAQDHADIVIKSPGIPKRFMTKPHTTATNLFHAYMMEQGMKNTIIGITGSKGKSTTSSLIADIIRASGRMTHLIGNIGVVALEVVQGDIEPEDVFVMELSSYQCEDLDWSPHISVVTSIFPEHLDHHGSLESYIQAKRHIIANATSEDFLVFNPAYKELQELASHSVPTAVPFVEELPFDVSTSRLKGEHNIANIRAALTVAHLCEIPDDITRDAVIAFEPLPHRMKEIGTYHGIHFVDDAIATAPEPTIFAIQTFGNVDTIFLGGQDRGYDFSRLVEVMVDAGIRNIALFPDTTQKIEETIATLAPEAHFTILKTSSMEEAVRFAYEHTAPGKTCLLSMASPSYSLWKNFQEKGDEFTECVRRIAETL